MNKRLSLNGFVTTAAGVYVLGFTLRKNFQTTRRNIRTDQLLCKDLGVLKHAYDCYSEDLKHV